MQQLMKLVIFLMGCTLLVAPPVFAQQTIKFGLHQNKPLNFLDTDNQVKGLVIDVFTYIADKENWEIEYISCAWGDCLDKLKNGEIDVLSAIGYTQKRHNTYDFTSNPLITNWGLIVTQPGSAMQSILDLDGKTIGVMKRAGHTVAFQNLLENFNINAKYLVVDDFLSVFRLVHEKKVDVGVVNRLIASQYANDYNVLKSSIIFNPIEIRYAFTKNRHTEMISAVDRYLLKLRGSPNSIYFQSIDRWFGDMKTTSIPTWLKWLGVFTLLAIGILVILNSLLNYRVKQKTKQLEKEISEHRQTLKVQQASDKSFRHLFESINDSVFVHLLTEDNLPGRFVQINEVACKKLGYSRQEFLQLTPHDIRVPDDKVHPHEIKNKLLTHGHIIFETKHLTKEGQHIPVESHIQLFDYDGQRAVLSIARDITERKQVESALYESEKRFRIFFKQGLIGMTITSFEKVLLDANDAFCDMLGYSFNELSQMTWPELTHPDDLEPDLAQFRRLLAGEISNYSLEKRFIRSDSKIVYTAISINAMYKTDDNSVSYILAIIQDISDRNKAKVDKTKLENQLQQAQKMESIGTLAGGIAHDFNNILSPVVGYAEMLLEDVSEDSPFKESLNAIYTSALRAKDLVKQILTFSRQESNELKLMKMQPIVKEALKLIRSTIPTTIEIKQDINADCGLIKADPTQIHQIVMNLTTNAYHAMEETGGELRVSLREIKLETLDLMNPEMAPGAYACLIVSDTGVGMDKNVTDKIFDPFFTTKAIGKGTGMGLSVVHGIVTNMGGAVQVYSEQGKGTKFHVYFPIEKNSFVKHSTQTHETIQGGTENILLVDDEEAIIVMGEMLLERLGYQVTSRTSSVEALEAFRAAPNKFDLVITDMAMPNMPGDKLSVELVKIRSDIPVLLCTGFSETMSEEKAASLGIKGFLLKPIVMKDLSQKIREVLDENKG